MSNIQGNDRTPVAELSLRPSETQGCGLFSRDSQRPEPFRAGLHETSRTADFRPPRAHRAGRAVDFPSALPRLTRSDLKVAVRTGTRGQRAPTPPRRERRWQVQTSPRGSAAGSSRHPASFPPVRPAGIILRAARPGTSGGAS